MTMHLQNVASLSAPRRTASADCEGLPRTCPAPITTRSLLVGVYGWTRQSGPTAALATAGGIGLLVALAAAQPVTVEGVDIEGPFRARCGVDYQLFGHPSPSVRAACTGAFAGHALPLVAGLAVAIVAAAWLIGRYLREHTASGIPGEASPAGEAGWLSPRRAVIATVAAAAIAIGGGSLGVVTVHTSDDAGPLTARCGISFYLRGASNSAVTTACRDVYATRARLLGGSVLVLVVSLAVLGVDARRRRGAETDDSAGTAAASQEPDHAS